MAKQRAKYGKLNICQADGWHYHSTFRLTILLEKVNHSSILLLVFVSSIYSDNQYFHSCQICLLNYIVRSHWKESPIFIFKGQWPLTGLLLWTTYVLSLLHRFNLSNIANSKKFPVVFSGPAGLEKTQCPEEACIASIHTISPFLRTL